MKNYKYRAFTVDELSPEDRKIYDEQLAMQPQLIREADERKKRELPARKGILYIGSYTIKNRNEAETG